MRLFEKREDPIRLMRRRITVAILLLLIALVVRGAWSVYQKERESRTLRQKAEAQLTSLKGREGTLRADIAQLRSDRGVEEVLREEYELAKKGEGVIVIVNGESPPSLPLPTTMEKFKSWFSWW